MTIAQFQAVLANQTPHSQVVQQDNSHGRQVERTVQVFAAPPTLAEVWQGATSLVVVHRQGFREGQAFARTSFYLSSLSADGLEIGLGIRGHRDIENGLHWVKDVVFNEDAAPFAEFNPALNWAGLNSIAINLFRSRGYHSLTKAIRLVGNDLLKLLSLLKTN